MLEEEGGMLEEEGGVLEEEEGGVCSLSLFSPLLVLCASCLMVSIKSSDRFFASAWGSEAPSSPATSYTSYDITFIVNRR